MHINPRSTAGALACVAVLCTPAALAAIWELPRSTSAMPVQAILTCESPRCEVAEHCARYDRWDTITDADFRNEWTMENGQAVTTPRRASHNLLCAVSVREGRAYIRPIRYLRERDAAGAWRYVSITRDWGLREMVSAEAPETEYDFYQLVKGKRLCLGTCGRDDEYVYFTGDAIGSSIVSRRFTHFAPGIGSAMGDWEYEHGGSASASLTFDYDGPSYGTIAYTCWMSLTFQSDESGTYTASCDDEDNTTDSGTWIVASR